MMEESKNLKRVNSDLAVYDRYNEDLGVFQSFKLLKIQSLNIQRFDSINKQKRASMVKMKSTVANVPEVMKIDKKSFIP